MIQRSNWGLFEPSQYCNSRGALMNQFGNFNCSEIDKQIRLAQAKQLDARHKIRGIVDEQ